MMLRNLMEDKKLNLNQPFLSVRRHSAPVTLPKDDKRKKDNSLLVIPQLPPHRPELKSGPVRNPGSVPFVWEHAPGRPKEDIKPQTQNFQRPPIAPKLPPNKYPNGSQQDSQSPTESVKDVESLKETVERLETSESGNSDEAYVDAADALTRSESFFFNCSVSGVSGMEDLNADQSGSFSTDIQTREFMMDRFLPAAKAMTSESPQYAPKKQPIVQEQPQAKKIMNPDKPSLRYGPSFAKRYYHSQENEEEEEEEEESDDGYDQHGNFSAICCLLPRLGLKSSLCLISPVSAMSVRTRALVSPGNNAQTRSSSAGSYSETENESKSYISELSGQIRTAELEANKSSLRHENSQSERYNTSTYCGEPLSSHKEREVIAISEETKNNGSVSERKGFKTFRELLADEGSPRNSDAGPVEKTVYVDTVQTVKSPNVQDTKGDCGSREEDHGTKDKTMDRVHIIDSSFEDFKNFDNVDNKAKLVTNDQKLSEFNIAPSIDKSNKKREMMERLKAFGEIEDIDLISNFSERTEVAEIEKVATESVERRLPRRKTPENSHKKYSEFPVPPPLPKSPSDSWLCRTLPTISAKNASLRSTNPQNQFGKVSTRNIKWETIVKSTNMQNHHLHYSEGMMTSIPET